MNESLNHYSRRLMNALFPRKCPFCGQSVGKDLICSNCRKNLPETKQHFVCFGKKYSFATAPLYENGMIEKAITELQTKRKPEQLPFFGRLLAECAAERLSEKFDVISYLPSEKSAVRKLGYDPVRFLTASMCVDWHVAPTSIFDEDKNGKAEHCSVAHPEQIIGKRVLLVMDWMKPEEELERFAEIVRKAGAKEVLFLALAIPRECT